MTLSLKKISGLEIWLNPETLEIRFGDNISVGKKSVRLWQEMKEFVENPSAEPTREEIYYVFRNVSETRDAGRIKEKELRYDITVIPTGLFVSKHKEYFRTAGHYHPPKAETAVPYPEVYEVLYGRGQFLIQRRDPNNPAILSEVYIVEAGPGEKVLMPPGFGHISVNTGKDALVLANWIADNFQYDYTPYQKFKGGGYWLVEGFIQNTIEFEKNHNYAEIPEIKKLRPKELPEFGLIRGKPMYEVAHALERLDFLRSPENFERNLGIEHCFKEIG
ncbi:MAG: glucose-6-phosphate isomerase family protein [Candidatus Sungiibacteriota bacterium]